MELVDGELVNELGHRHHEPPRAARADNGIDDARIVGVLDGVVPALREQLLDDVRIIGRHRLTHLRARVFHRRLAADGHEQRQHMGIPGILIFDLRQQEVDLLLRVIDERGELRLLVLAQFDAERLLDARAHIARAVAQQMRKRLVLAVDIRREHLGPLGEIQDRVQVHNLGRSLRGCGKRPGEQSQVMQLVLVHAMPPRMIREKTPCTHSIRYVRRHRSNTNIPTYVELNWHLWAPVPAPAAHSPTETGPPKSTRASRRSCRM